MFRAVHFIGLKRRSVLTRENLLRAARRATRSTCTAVVHVEGEGRWLRVTERDTWQRRQELRRYAAAFDDGYYLAARVAEELGVRIPNGRGSAAPYATLRDVILNYTDDEVLAARVALDLVGPARSSVWEER